MSFMIIWILQMLVFFLFISAVVFFFSKKGSGTTNQNRPNQDNRQQPVEKEWAPVERKQPANKPQTRNVQHNRNQSTHSERKEQQHRDRRQDLADHRAERLKNRRYSRIEEKQKPVLQNVVTINNTKKKTKSPTFKGSHFKQGIIYKEILDKPLSLRDE